MLTDVCTVQSFRTDLATTPIYLLYSTTDCGYFTAMLLPFFCFLNTCSLTVGSQLVAASVTVLLSCHVDFCIDKSSSHPIPSFPS